MILDVACLSSTYTVRLIGLNDIEEAYLLCKDNPLYYKYHQPMITRQGIFKDMEALPHGITKENKYYVGFYSDKRLLAIMDIIVGYPNATCAYIGFFMMKQCKQGSHIGTSIVQDVVDYIRTLNFKEIQLGYMKNNPQSEHFWRKQGFHSIGEKELAEGIVVKMKYTL